MPRAFMVIGLAYGDEGKGSWVDHLVRQHGIKRVVRFNGGAQAGHQVVLPDGRAHIFSQFGSGTFAPGVETYLSRLMLVEPEALLLEGKVLDALSQITISEDAPVVTPMNRLLNRMLEVSRGDARHGSCGFGIGITQGDVDSLGERALYVRDLRADGGREKLRDLYQLKLAFMETLDTSRCPELRKQFENMDFNLYEDLFLSFYHRVRVVSDEQFLEEMISEDVVFEGAQGVLLDQDVGFFPNVTRSHCTFKNAEALLRDAGFMGETTRVGLLRGYATRHGAGPFVTEDRELNLPPCHNHFNDWQGNFRLGWFDAVSARYAIEAVGGVNTLAITNLDRMFGQERVKICVGYENCNETEFVQSDRIQLLEPNLKHLAQRTDALNRVTPRYVERSGWDADDTLGLIGYLEALETELKCPISAYSVTPHQKIYR